MGKRKRSTTITDLNDTTTTTSNSKDPSSSDDMPCSSGTELLSQEKSSDLIHSNELNPLSHGMDVTDSTMKLLNMQSSLTHQHYNLGRSIFLKRSRHYYGHQYSRRNPGNHASASSSHGKNAPSCDERLAFKLASHPGLGSRSHTDFSEYREKAFCRPERIRFSSLVMDAASSDAVKMVCGICQKLLRRELTVVAILVCGHVYHADCLEQRTSLENICDPPCLLCLDLLPQVGASRKQE